MAQLVATKLPRLTDSGDPCDSESQEKDGEKNDSTNIRLLFDYYSVIIRLMFQPKYIITHPLLENIKRIYSLVQSLNQRHFPDVVLVELQKTAEAVSTYASTSIEGNPLPLTDVKAILKNAPQNIRDSEREVLNYNDILKEINRKLEKGPLPVTLEFILSIQKKITQKLLPAYQTGKLRADPVFVNDPRERKTIYWPPDAQDVPALLKDLIRFVDANKNRIDPLILAGLFHKEMVIIHPFMDGNGRLHRFLIHDVLSSSGFTPKGIVLPVSAVILANLDQYVHTLERFSKPIQARTEYDPDTLNIPAKGNDGLYFRYFDATDQVLFLFWALERTITHDLEEEISFLLGFDKAYNALKADLDWPAHSLDLFIRLVHQNKGSLSKAKRKSHFEWMTDTEVKQSEAAVNKAFEKSKAP